MRRCDGFGGRQFGEDAVADIGGERRVDPAGHGPGRMHALACQAFDHLLAEFAQCDAVTGQFGVAADHAEDVAARGIGVHAQQQIGRGEMEEAERVGLHDLSAVQKFA